MNIFLKTLTIINFKGIKNFTVNFKEVTNIYGANATGKTTVFDAFTFLLFGKDSSDKKDFNIKPLDQQGIAAQRQENEVSGVIEVDGQQITVRHVHKEKWVKKRGEEEHEFTGNEHIYFWNEVPVNAGEYQNKVNEVLKEHVFKLITNPLYFPSLKWQDQRSVLQDIAGEITDEDIASTDKKFAAMIDQLSGKSLKEFKTMISAQKKNIKQQLVEIPGRIDEAERSKPEPVDVESVNKKLESLEIEYSNLEKAILDKNEANELENAEVRKIQQRIHSLKLDNQSIEARIRQEHQKEIIDSKSALVDASAKVDKLQSSLRVQQSQLDQLNKSHADHIERINRDIADIESRMDSLRVLFTATNAKEVQINDDDFVCYGCGRPYEDHDIEARKAKQIELFNQNKINELNSINERGLSLKSDLAKRQQEISDAESQANSLRTTLEATIETISRDLSSAKEELEVIKNNGSVHVLSVEERLLDEHQYQDNAKEISDLTTSLENRPQTDFGDLRVKKSTIGAEIDSLRRKLNVSELIDKAEKRIEELKDQEKTLSQELADLEKQEFTIERFEKAKSDELESRVNGMFKYAKFRLFNRLINGGEEPTCVVTYEGVPFPDLNNAAKVQVGIDIINTLSAYYGVTAPVFLDNRESVSKIPDTAAQVINLIVSPEDQELRVA
ncbi:AAA family ATPase [Olivibacter sp. 47]|uniref:AAA family ATPase n=1 Tax=Olivibacter sp. 47 TaxID=3056486 RepID=UPI0025A471DB|nr:AAA family ATPase [Olivibacter sp. 47]MDM8174759.1 AAA family ATPase [Olivibacter sp. 47]